MTRRVLPLLVLWATVAAGCGSGGEAVPETPRAAAPTPPPAKLAATDGRVGPATVADGARLQRLQSGERRMDSGDRRGRDRMGVGAGASCADTELAPSAETLPAVEAATLCLINGERADAGLGPLTSEPRLASAAARHARAMVERQFFAHDGPDGDSVVDRIRDAGYIPTNAAWLVGENLAWGTGTLATPRSIVAAWMNSPGHRENILRSRFTEVGQGIVLGNPRSRDGAGATYAMTFGHVDGAATTPVANRRPAPSGKSRRAADEPRAERKRRKSRSARRAKARRAAVRRAKARKAARRAASSGRPVARRALAPKAHGN